MFYDVNFISKNVRYLTLLTFFHIRRDNLRTNIPRATLACSFKYNDQNVLIVCIYNPPKPSQCYIKPEEVQDIFGRTLNLAKTYSATLIYSDSNITDADWSV